jgi:anaerobic selenocysteine-containing dehydrogenase
LVLISRRQKHHLNSRKAAAGARDTPGIYVSPDDATERGLADGTIAIVRSKHGQLKGHVKIDPSLVPGAISVPHGWEGTHNVNLLTAADDTDAITGMPIFSNLPVEIAKAPNPRD